MIFHQCYLPSVEQEKMDHSHAALHVLEFHMWDFFYPMSARSSSLLTVDSDYRFCVCLSMVMHIHERVF